jgi:hypothetical protein
LNVEHFAAPADRDERSDADDLAFDDRSGIREGRREGQRLAFGDGGDLLCQRAAGVELDRGPCPAARRRHRSVEPQAGDVAGGRQDLGDDCRPDRAVEFVDDQLDQRAARADEVRPIHFERVGVLAVDHLRQVELGAGRDLGGIGIEVVADRLEQRRVRRCVAGRVDDDLLRPEVVVLVEILSPQRVRNLREGPLDHEVADDPAAQVLDRGLGRGVALKQDRPLFLLARDAPAGGGDLLQRLLDRVALNHAVGDVAVRVAIVVCVAELRVVHQRRGQRLRVERSEKHFTIERRRVVRRLVGRAPGDAVPQPCPAGELAADRLDLRLARLDGDQAKVGRDADRVRVLEAGEGLDLDRADELLLVDADLVG